MSSLDSPSATRMPGADPPLSAAAGSGSSRNEAVPRATAGGSGSMSGASLPIAEPVVRPPSPDSAAAAAAAAGEPAGGAHPPMPLLVRVLSQFNLGLQELRMLLLILPCLTVLLFVSGNKAAGGAVLALTLLLTLAVCWRLALLLRLRHRQYDSVPGGAPALYAGGHLGALARAARADQQGMSVSALRAHALMNPTAVRLAMLDRDFTPADYEMLQRLDEEHAAQSFTGIPQSQVERLPTFRMKKQTGKEAEENICTICLEERAEGEEVRALLCGHYFHSKSCIDKWLRTSKKCPTCQFKIEL